MVNVTIKDVPDDAVLSVKEYAMVAIERYLKARDLQIEESKKDKFETDVDLIRISNDLEKKYKDKSE